MYHSVSFWMSGQNTGYSGTVWNKQTYIFDKNISMQDTIKFYPLPFDFQPRFLFDISGTNPVPPSKMLFQILDSNRFSIYTKEIDLTSNIGVTIYGGTGEKTFPDIIVPKATKAEEEYLKENGTYPVRYLFLATYGISDFGKNPLANSNTKISVTINYRTNFITNGRNTWASWRLIPTSRPFISPPTQKTQYQDIPYTNGELDLSEFGLSDGVFNDREGSFEFALVNPQVSGYDISKRRANDGNLFSRELMVDGDFDHWTWNQTYSTIMDYLQGERRKIVLEDDPSFYYIGRTEVETLNPDEHYTVLSIKYKVYPYKKVRFSTTEDWLWDAIDFEENLDIKGIKNITLYPISGSNYWETKFSTLRQRVYPKVKVSAGKNTTGDQNGVLLCLIINDSSGQKEIYFGSGTNNIIKVNDVSTKENLYFEGMNIISLTAINCSKNTSKYETLTGNGYVTFSIDYRLEGF